MIEIIGENDTCHVENFYATNRDDAIELAHQCLTIFKLKS